MADSVILEVSQLHGKLRGLINYVQEWNRCHPTMELLPTEIIDLWHSIQQLHQSCEEAEKVIREGNYRWHSLSRAEKICFRPVLEAADSLEARFRGFRDTPTAEFAFFALEEYNQIRQKFLQCDCQLRCYLEIVACYAITNLTHQYITTPQNQQQIYDLGDRTHQASSRRPEHADDNRGSTSSSATVKFTKHTKTLVFGRMKITAQFIISKKLPKDCGDYCPCKCHSTRLSESGSPVQGVTSKMRSWLRATQRCTISNCRRLGVKKRQVIIRQTTYVMQQYAIALVSLGSRMKLEIKTNPIIPETSDAIRFCQTNNKELLRELILSGKASLRDTGPDGWTLLHNAAYCSSIDVVKFLLAFGADIDTAEIKSRKPSHFAMFKALRTSATDEQKQIVTLLQGDSNLKEDFELSPILAAVLRSYDSRDSERPDLNEILRLVDDLVTATHPINWRYWIELYMNRSPLFGEIIAIFQAGINKKRTPTSIFRDLLEQTDTVQQWTPVLWAAYIGNVKVLQSLVTAGADITYITPSGRNVFHHASESSNVEAVRYLFSCNCSENGVDFNLADDWLETPLHLAAEQNPDMIKIYLEHGANMFARQGDGLLPICYPRILHNPYRFLNLACYLAARVEGCPEINSVDDSGRTAIFYYLETPNCVELLLDHGADIDVVDDKKNTVLHYACHNNYVETLSLLLARSSVPLTNMRNIDNLTPLLVSFERKNLECARIILRRTHVLEITDKNGWTVLHHAAKSGDQVCVDLALGIAEVDIFARTPDGRTAFDILGDEQTI